jgi:hypothetical protein
MANRVAATAIAMRPRVAWEVRAPESITAG